MHTGKPVPKRVPALFAALRVAVLGLTFIVLQANVIGVDARAAHPHLACIENGGGYLCTYKERRVSRYGGGWYGWNIPGSAPTYDGWPYSGTYLASEAEVLAEAQAQLVYTYNACAVSGYTANGSDVMVSAEEPAGTPIWTRNFYVFHLLRPTESGCNNPIDHEIHVSRWTPELCREGTKDLGPWLGRTACAVQQAACQRVGNPVELGCGGKVAVETDYVGGGVLPLRLARHYANQRTFSNDGSVPPIGGFGPYWMADYHARLSFSAPSNPSAVFAHRPDGSLWGFRLSGSAWVGTVDSKARLVALPAGAGWTLTDPSERAETYDAAGKLTALATPGGATQTLTYDGSGRLASVTDPSGRQLAFAYDAQNRIAQVTGPGGFQANYLYDPLHNLATVTYPGAVSRQYLYEYPAGSYFLTGVVDELGTRTGKYTYHTDSANYGRVAVSEGAGGVNRYDFTYSIYSNSTISVLDPLGASVTMNAAMYANDSLRLPTSLSAPCAGCSGTAAQTMAYDGSGNLTAKTDFNGKATCYAYDAGGRNVEVARVEGIVPAESCATVLASPPSRPDVRKISTTWHATYRLPTAVAEPNRRTTFTHDGAGNVLTRTVQATLDPTGAQGLAATLTGTSRTWTYTYNGLGQVLTADGPRTDVNDTTTYAYYTTNDPGGKYRIGDLQTLTNAAGHVTTFNEYDAHGRPQKITDPNGLVTLLGYHPRGWLIQRQVGPAAGPFETTTYEYDAAGQLAKVTLPDTSTLQYTYDDAHRLTRIDDGLGNKIVYTLDAMGNRIREEAFDPGDVLVRKRQQVFDSLNRLHQTVGAQ